MSIVYQAGNTVRLKCTFHDFDQQPINPGLVKLIVYNHRYEKIDEYSAAPSGTTGEFICDYVLPYDATLIYYEWYGEIEGKPVIKRESLKISFI